MVEIALDGAAAATSAPGATRVGPAGRSHLFDPVGAPGPRWASVTVLAETAARADALSTAIAAAPQGMARALLRDGGGRRALLITPDGRLADLRA
jgi:thiamine biosynthesis lipoprotein